MYYMPRFSQPRRRPSAPRPNAAQSTVQAWREAYPAIAEWIDANVVRDNDFACSLNAQLNQRGSLTANQIAAVERCIVRGRERAAERRALESSAAPCSVAPVEAAFAHARAAGIKRPYIALADFKFNPAGATSANPGAVYVKRHDGTYLGKVMGGRFVRSRDCDVGTERDVLAVCADPKAAAIAYGKRFGKCCICSRTLTDPKSVDAGIGPVCQDRMGW